MRPCPGEGITPGPPAQEYQLAFAVEVPRPPPSPVPQPLPEPEWVAVDGAEYIRESDKPVRLVEPTRRATCPEGKAIELPQHEVPMCSSWFWAGRWPQLEKRGDEVRLAGPPELAPASIGLFTVEPQLTAIGSAADHANLYRCPHKSGDPVAKVDFAESQLLALRYASDRVSESHITIGKQLIVVLHVNAKKCGAAALPLTFTSKVLVAPKGYKPSLFVCRPDADEPCAPGAP
jgi:hypothetical protein